VPETKAICEAILKDIYVPVLKNPFEDFTHLSTTLLKGMWPIVPEIDVEGFSSYHKYLSGIEVEPCSNWYSRMMFNFQIFVHEVSKNLCFWAKYIKTILFTAKPGANTYK